MRQSDGRPETIRRTLLFFRGRNVFFKRHSTISGRILSRRFSTRTFNDERFYDQGPTPQENGQPISNRPLKSMVIVSSKYGKKKKMLFYYFQKNGDVAGKTDVDTTGTIDGDVGISIRTI